MIAGMTADVRQSDATVAREVELRNRVQLSGVGNPKSNMAQGGVNRRNRTAVDHNARDREPAAMACERSSIGRKLSLLYY